MTHGCLKIRAAGEKRNVLLHTHHTGSVEHLEEMLRKIPRRLAKFCLRYYVGQFAKTDRWRTLAAFQNWNRRDPLLRQLVDYPPSVAAWVCAQYGNYLTPCPPAFVKDLPLWGGQDMPFELVVSESGLWTLRQPDDFHREYLTVFEDFDPAAEALRLMFQTHQRRMRDGRRSSKPRGKTPRRR